jgi:hypothetical protein
MGWKRLALIPNSILDIISRGISLGLYVDIEKQRKESMIYNKGIIEFRVNNGCVDWVCLSVWVSVTYRLRFSVSSLVLRR